MEQTDGTPYVCLREVEQSLVVLLGSTASEVVERARIEDRDHPDYVASESLLYLIRRPPAAIHEDALRDLFIILRRRVLQAIPVFARRLPGSKKPAHDSIERAVQEVVLHKFQEMLCRDRAKYEKGLDFFEVRFNQAIARLRSTARRDVHRTEYRFEPLAGGDTSDEPSKEVQAALNALTYRVNPESMDFLYRSKLFVAIDSLPLEERRVVELLLQKMPIDSQEPRVTTIVKGVGCSEKTVRNRRDRAFAKLRDALREEEEL